MSQKLWIYQPWLDALGLEMPQTTEEFEQVLLAFKEQDPNGNGEADEIPLSTTIDVEGWQNGPLDLFFMNSFLYNPGEDATGPWLILQDGQVTPVYNTPEWKEGLKYLHRLYAQGLIDPQSFTQDVDGLQRLGNNPDEVILGAAPSGWWTTSSPSTRACRITRWTDYVAVPPLEGPEGVRYAAWDPATDDPAAVITSACKDPALAVRWIDTLYWQEATLRSDDGVLGEDWRWAEEGETDVDGEQAALEDPAAVHRRADRPCLAGNRPHVHLALLGESTGGRSGDHRPRILLASSTRQRRPTSRTSSRPRWSCRHWRSPRSRRSPSPIRRRPSPSM